MSDENFFARWSRRKAEAAKAAADKRDAEDADKASTPQPPATAESGSEAAERHPATPDGSPSSSTATGDIASFDPKDLPPIDSIGPDTDVSMFLRPGVPADLARAALRRAWTADPAIRDYIGLSENSWDFTAPQGVPGFAPLSSEDAERLLAALTNQSSQSSQLPSLPAFGERRSSGTAKNAQIAVSSKDVAVDPGQTQPLAQVNSVENLSPPSPARVCSETSTSSACEDDRYFATQHTHSDSPPEWLPHRKKSSDPPQQKQQVQKRGGRALPR